MKKPTPEEIKAASYPAIQERAREMDAADETSGVCLRGEHRRCETAMAQAYGFPVCRCACHMLTAPKPDAPSEAALKVAHAQFPPHKEWDCSTPGRSCICGRDACVTSLALAIDEHTREAELKILAQLNDRGIERLRMQAAEGPKLAAKVYVAEAVRAEKAEAENQELREALELAINSLGDVALIAWGKAVDPKRWAEQLIAALKSALR